MAAVSFDGVSKVYADGTEALRELSLNIGDGDLAVFVGPSGCGKTTALRMVAGLEDISGGTISIGGRTINNLEPQERDVAMVFQNYALYPHMTVQDNIAFPLKLKKVPKHERQRRVRDVAHTLGLDQQLHRKPPSSMPTASPAKSTAATPPPQNPTSAKTALSEPPTPTMMQSSPSSPMWPSHPARHRRREGAMKKEACMVFRVGESRCGRVAALGSDCNLAHIKRCRRG
jgi:hypothetical protein